ncbi:hypothetical protein [Mycolicibacterium nivoides]|uniref:DUF4440 domain-containing protein n=1 Tax=Mycolicibacterium nivoides TaxID=2487344 RepID=A0ABW9LJW8_9MYCO
MLDPVCKGGGALQLDTQLHRNRAGVNSIEPIDLEVHVVQRLERCRAVFTNFKLLGPDRGEIATWRLYANTTWQLVCVF